MLGIRAKLKLIGVGIVAIMAGTIAILFKVIASKNDEIEEKEEIIEDKIEEIEEKEQKIESQQEVIEVTQDSAKEAVAQQNTESVIKEEYHKEVKEATKLIDDIIEEKVKEEAESTDDEPVYFEFDLTDGLGE